MILTAIRAIRNSCKRPTFSVDVDYPYKLYHTDIPGAYEDLADQYGKQYPTGFKVEKRKFTQFLFRNFETDNFRAIRQQYGFYTMTVGYEFKNKKDWYLTRLIFG